jgi:hypothetical protein
MRFSYDGTTQSQEYDISLYFYAFLSTLLLLHGTSTHICFCCTALLSTLLLLHCTSKHFTFVALYF